MATNLAAIARYVAALRLGKPVILIDPKRGHGMIARFATDVVHPDLALLLTIGGSTGNPKVVRLSRAAVLTNAEQIAETLGITADDVAITSLPLVYSYGLSVLNSHLLRGATVVLERTGPLRRDFWTAAAECGVTSMAFVPHQYEILDRLRFDPATKPTLRTLTQAGGRLRAELVTDFAQRIAAVRGRLFVMYGPDRGRTADGHAAAGPAGRQAGLGRARAAPQLIHDRRRRGRLSRRERHDGYAETAADLSKGDELGGVLHTGDLGRLDDERFLFPTGRIKRIFKVFGVRVNLDDVERRFLVAAVAGDDRLHVFRRAAVRG